MPDINSLPGYITPVMLTNMGLHSAQPSVPVRAGQTTSGSAAMTNSHSTDFCGIQLSTTESTTIKAMIREFKTVPK